MRPRILHITLLLLLSAIVEGQSQPQTSFKLEFQGNKIFSDQELLAVTEGCLSTDKEWTEKHNAQTLSYCLSRLSLFLKERGYLQATVEKPEKGKFQEESAVVVIVNEGALFRLGDVTVTGSKLLSPAKVIEILDIKPGEIADGERLSVWLHKRVRKVYADLGYFQYFAELEPKYEAEKGSTEGIVNIKTIIDEGPVFTIRSLTFEGNFDLSRDTLLRQMLVRSGEVFNQSLFDESVRLLNDLKLFETIDADKDVDYEWDKKTPELNLTIRLKKRGS